MNDAQKRGLIFLREAGAIDNSTYRQINGCDVLKASSELRFLRDNNILEQKGKGRYTYYVPGVESAGIIAGKNIVKSQITLPISQNTPPSTEITPPSIEITQPNTEITQLPTELEDLIKNLGKKSDQETMENVILQLCRWKPLTLDQISGYLSRDPKHLFRVYIKPLRESGKLQYTKPEMPNHPEQAYFSKE